MSVTKKSLAGSNHCKYYCVCNACGEEYPAQQLGGITQTEAQRWVNQHSECCDYAEQFRFGLKPQVVEDKR